MSGGALRSPSGDRQGTQSGEEPAKDCSNTFHDLSERGNKDVGH